MIKINSFLLRALILGSLLYSLLRGEGRSGLLSSSRGWGRGDVLTIGISI